MLKQVTLLIHPDNGLNIATWLENAPKITGGPVKLLDEGNRPEWMNLLGTMPGAVVVRGWTTRTAREITARLAHYELSSHVAFAFEHTMPVDEPSPTR